MNQDTFSTIVLFILDSYANTDYSLYIMRVRTIVALSTIIPTLGLAFSIQTIEAESALTKRLLGIIFLIIACITTGMVILSNYQFVELFPFGYMLTASSLTLAPLFFLFIRSSYTAEFRVSFYHLGLLLPPALLIAFLLYMTITSDLYYVRNTQPLFYPMFELGWGLLFYTLTIIFIKKEGGSVRDFFFNFFSPRLNWLRFLFCSLLFILWSKLFTLHFFTNDNMLYTHGLTSYYYFSALFTVVALYVLLNAARILKKARYRSSKLSSESKDSIYSCVQQKLKSERLYLDSDLSLQTLALACNTSAKSLSQIINEKEGVHFNEFINAYRIGFACTLLKDPNSTFSIIEVQLESGFNSKSCFNTSFKKITGLTPRQFREKEKQKR